jgi:hypothetical protein
MIEHSTDFGVGEFEDMYQGARMTKVSKTPIDTCYYDSL